jgi:hypothetical protein
VRLLPVSLFLFSAAIATAGPPLTSQTPVSNFRLPTFTEQGHRSMLLQGSQALVAPNRVDLKDLNLTLFTGDAASTVETVILSPVATANLASETIHGDGTVRVIRDDLEITGTGWSYDHHQKKVSITANARIAFHAQLPDMLK